MQTLITIAWSLVTGALYLSEHPAILILEEAEDAEGSSQCRENPVDTFATHAPGSCAPYGRTVAMGTRGS